jgi:hypothetical protein
MLRRNQAGRQIVASQLIAWRLGETKPKVVGLEVRGRSIDGMKLNEHSLVQDPGDGNPLRDLPIENHVLLVFRSAQILKVFASAPKQRMIGKLLQMRFN